MSANPKLLELRDEDRQVLESMLVEFDRSWTEELLAQRVRDLPHGPLRLPALVEMVKVDLERQWQRGRLITIEAYLSTYPELGTPETVPADLIQAEYEVRRQFGRPVDLSEMVRRFPRQAEQLRRLVEQARQVVSDRDVPRSETVSFHDETSLHRAGAAVHVAPTQLPTAPADSNETPGQDAAAAPGTDWSIGQLPEKFGRYRILKCLGQGGMGTVYLAHDTQLDRQVAIKVPHFDRDAGTEVLERFYRESRAAATLDHPNICPVHDVGQIDGMHYLVMAYIEGKPLSDFVRKDKPIPPRQVAAIVRKLALALQEAHNHGVVHRDLKPANIMANKRRELVIMDFGLARLTKKSGQSESRLTQSGVVMGTPSYMSPEQVMSDIKAMGPACDIYSLGVIMYELLTGRLPFQGVLTAVLAQIVVDQPATPSKYRPDIGPELESICLRAMAKKIEDRYASMAELAKAIGDYLSSPQSGRVAGAARSPGAPVIESSSPQPRALTQPMLGVRRLDPSHPVADKPAKSSAPATESPRPKDAREKGRTPKQPVSVIGRVVDENLEQFFAAAAEEEAPLPRFPPRSSAKPHWPWLAAAGVAALLVLGGIIYIATNKGTIKLEVNDPSVTVFLDGDEVRIENLGEPITLRAGEHRLIVKRGDIELEAEPRTFTVRRGGNPAVEVQLLKQVASAGTPPKPTARQVSEPTATAKEPEVAATPAAAGPGQPLDRNAEPMTVGEVRRFDGHTDTVWSLAHSADGRKLWTGSSDGTVRIWDRDTGATVRQIELRGGRVTRVACADDFRTILTSHPRDRFVRVWNTESGQELRQLQGHASPVWSISLSPDGRRALAGAEDGAVRLWDVNTGNEIGRLDGHTGLVQSVVFSPDGCRALSGSQDKLVCLWDLDTRKRLKTFGGHTGKVCSLAFSSDGRRAVSGGGGVDARGLPADSTVHVWDLEGGQELQCLRGHTNGVTGVAFTPDARHVVSASYDKTVRVWDVQTGKELHRFEGHAEVLECVAVAPDGRFAVSGGHDKVVRLWRLPVPETAPASLPVPLAPAAKSLTPTPTRYRDHAPGLIWSTPPGADWWWRGAFSPTGNFIAAGRQTRPAGHKESIRIHVWPIHESQNGDQSFVLRHPLNGNQSWSTVEGLVFAPDGKKLASSALDGSICFWDLTATPPQLVTRLEPFDGPINALAFSPDSRLVAAGVRKPGRPVKIWDVASATQPREIATLESTDQDEIVSVAFSRTGSTLYIGAAIPNVGGRVRAWNYQNGTTTRVVWNASNPKEAWARSLSVSPEGDRLGFGISDKAYVINAATGAVQTTFSGHSNSVIGFAFTADGARCVTGSYDGTIRMWSAATGQQLWQNDKPHGTNEGLGLSPDGRLVFAASHGGGNIPDQTDNVAQLWRLPDSQPALASIPTADGWVSLFNGKDLTGWRTTGVAAGWSVENGEIVAEGGQQGQGGKGGWLMTEKDYSNFELQLEFATAQGTDSGVAFRCDPGETLGNAQAEIQIADEQDAELVRKLDELPYRRTGALAGQSALRTLPSLERGRWHTMAIGLRDRQLKVTIEGTVTVDTNLNQHVEEGQKMKRRGIWQPSGPIGLQKGRGNVRFRNIRVRELGATSAAGENGLSGAFLVEFAKDKGWSFVYEFSGTKMQRKLVKTPGTEFQPIDGEATVQPLDGGKILLVHKDRGEHELWQPGLQAGTFQVQRGDQKTYLSNPLRGTARKLSPDELRNLTGTAKPAERPPTNPVPKASLKPARLERLDELNTPHGDSFPWLSRDGLTIYWEVKEPEKPNAIWTARRKDSNSPFGNMTRLLDGRHPTVTGDGLQMILLRRPAGQRESLHVAAPPIIDQPFGPPREITELRSTTEEREAHCVAPDGLTLYLQRGFGPGKLCVTSRTPGGVWQPPESLPLADPLDHKLTWPFLTADRLRLLCTHEGDSAWAGSCSRRGRRSRPLSQSSTTSTCPTAPRR